MKINTVTSQRRLLAPGWYYAEFTSAKFFPAGNPQRSGQGSTNPVLDVELITKGNSIEETEGIKLYDSQSLLPQSMWSALLVAKSAFGELDVDDDGEVEIEWSDMVGQPVMVQVSIQTYRGNRNNNVDHYAHVSTEIGPDGFPAIVGEEALLVGGETLIPVEAAD